jgi:hypothetical protein
MNKKSQWTKLFFNKEKFNQKKGQWTLPSSIVLSLLIFEGIFALLVNEYTSATCIKTLEQPNLILTNDIMSNIVNTIAWLFAGLIYLVSLTTFFGITCKDIPTYIITTIQVPIIITLIYSLLIPVADIILKSASGIIDLIRNIIGGFLWFK